MIKRTWTLLKTAILLAAFPVASQAAVISQWVADDLADGPTTTWLNRNAGYNPAVIPVTAGNDPVTASNALNGHKIVNFDGNDRFTVANGLGNPMANIGDFSITSVFMTDTAGTAGPPNQWYLNSGLVAMELPGATNDWALAFNSNGHVVAGMGGTDLGVESTGSILSDGLGHIATMTRQSNNVKLYIDGYLVGQRADVATSPRQDQPFSIGSIQTGGTGGTFFNGNMAEIQIHNTALTPTEAVSLATTLGATYGIPTFVPPPPPVPEILPAGPVHRYEFNGNANDSIGTAHGAVVGTGAVYGGGQLDLRANNGQSSNQTPVTSGAYVDLPNGTISDLGEPTTASGGKQATFEIWTTIETNRTWAEIYSFGKSDGAEGTAGGAGHSPYMTLIPQSGPGTGPMRLTHRGFPGGSPAENVVDDTAPLSAGVEHHLVGVWDENAGVQKLYLDGNLIGSSSILAGITLASLPDVNNFLGRSQWPDPLFDGQYNEFRIYDYALTTNQVLGNYLAGPNTVNAVPEPSTALLAVLGLVPLALLRRRRTSL
jgi:uncharacterized protein (TIGR03382 family)